MATILSKANPEEIFVANNPEVQLDIHQSHNSVKRIIFIDSKVEDHHNLILQLPSNSGVVILKPDQDGVMQMLTALNGKQELDSIDIISHGSPGALLLGSSEINSKNLFEYEEQFQRIGTYLSDEGDILLYGCEVAKGDAGRRLIEELAELTGSNIAASTSLTGAFEMGGDWVLDMHIGLIHTPALQLPYQNVLAIVSGTTANDILSGTTDSDRIYGLSGNDTLIGMAGSDVLFGGPGADALYGYLDFGILPDEGIGITADAADYQDAQTGVVANLANPVLNTGDAAGDTYYSIENLNGSSFSDTLTGNEFSNVLTGRNGNDVLNGGLSADTLVGGLGNDIYILADVFSTSTNPNFPGVKNFDTVTENANGGIDRVEINSEADPLLIRNYTLSANVENGLIYGVSNFTLTGNALDNRLTGNGAGNTLQGLGGNDVLNGGLGSDKLVGGLGNDTYILADVFSTSTDPNFPGVTNFDAVTENANEGIDQVEVNSEASILKSDYALSTNIENGVIYGVSNFSLTGNALDNRLTGNGAGNTLRGLGGGDILNGGLGVDTLVGGAGDDVYILNDAFSIISGITSRKQFDDTVENAGEGIDGVEVSSTNGLVTGYTLGNNIEWGSITGQGNFDLYGNGLGNLLIGNEAANRLSSGGNARGNDTDVLFGNGGNDWLVASENGQDELNGGEGADQFIFSAIDSLSLGPIDQLDKIVDFGLLGAVDNINVFNIDAKANTTGNNSFTFIGSSPFTAEGQISATQVGNDTVLSLNVIGTQTAEMQILLSDFNASSLTLGHFIL